MAKVQGAGAGNPVRGRVLGGQVAGRPYKALGPAGRRPLGMQRVERVAPGASRKPAPTGMRGVAGASFYKAAKPGSKIPKISVRIPRVDFNPGKVVGDAFSQFAPQDVLFRKISDRLKNPSGR